jgi:uncharacterized membrane protein YGL010W
LRLRAFEGAFLTCLWCLFLRGLKQLWQFGKALLMLGVGCMLLGRVLQTAGRRSFDARRAFFVTSF